MSQVTDAFTDPDGTLLTAHNASDGLAYTKGGGASTGEITSNRFRSTLNDAVAFWYPGTAPATADQQIQVQCKVGNTASTGVTLFLRTDTTLANGYGARYSAGAWKIFKWVANTRTEIATFTGGNVNAANGEIVIFKIVGSTLTVTVAGTQIISVTDTSIAAANRWGPGLFFTDVSATDIWVDDMDTKDVVSSTTVAAALNSSADFTAALTLNQYVASALDGSATTTAALTLNQYVASALDGSATVAAAITSQIALASSLVGNATLAAQVALQSSLSAALSGSATLSALLEDGFRASLTSTTSLTAQLTQTLQIATALTSSAALTANLQTQMRLAAALDASAVLASAISSNIYLVSGLVSSTTLGASATLRQSLAISLQGNAVLSANLFIPGISLALAATLVSSASLRAHLSDQSTINGKLQACVIKWLGDVTGVKSIQLNQNAPRPALPYSAVNVGRVSSQWDAGRSSPDTFNTVELLIPQDVSIDLTFYGPGAFVFAEKALDSLAKPSIQAVLEACGLAVVSHTPIANAARVVSDKYEEGASFAVIFRISDVLHDNSGSLGSVSLEGSYGSSTVAQTIN